MAPIRPQSTYTSTKPAVAPRAFHLSELPHRQLAKARRSGELVRVKAGWYLWRAELPIDQYERAMALHVVKIRVHAKSLPYGVYISHFSAGMVLGFPQVCKAEDVEVTDFRRAQFTREGIRVYRRPSMKPMIVLRDAIRTTSFPITAIEMMRKLDPPNALVIADYALRVGCQLDRLKSVNDELQLPRMRAQTSRILDLAEPGAESPPESRLRYWIIQADLGPVSTQHQIETAQGVFFSDLALAHLRIAIEYDGEVKYVDRESLMREKRREDAIRVAGWEFVRVTKADMQNVHRLVRRITMIAMKRARARTAAK